MSLRFIYGRAGSGKSTYCVEDIKKNLKEQTKNPLMLVVPEQFSFQAEKSIVNALGGTGIIDLEVTSFNRIAYNVLNQLGGSTKEIMDSSGKLMLIFNIINRLKDKLKVYSSASQQQGFINTISDIITELKRYDITPNELISSLELMEDDQFLKEKIEDISKIFVEFEEVLHRNYIDSEDELTLLCDKIDNCNMFDGAEIWIDEFISFTPQQYNIIEKLLKKVKRINITLCMDYYKEIDTTDMFLPIKNTESKLRKIAEDNGIIVDKSVVLKSDKKDRFKNNIEIRHIEENYFKYPYTSYSDKTNDIKIIKALNPYLEIESVAKEIVKISREEGIRFKNIAVITRDLEDYEKIIKATFNEYEIPHFLDKKKEIDDNPLIVLITSVMDIFNKNWSYEAVFRYLKTGLVNLEREDMDVLENYVIAYGIRGKNKWNSIWEYGNDELLEKVNEIRVAVIEPLMKFYSKLKGKKTSREICTFLYEFLCEIEVNKTIEFWVYKFKKEGNQELAKEYSQIWNMVIELLDQIVEIFKEDKIELKEFVKILSLGFGEHKMGLIPPSLDQVLVSDVQRVRASDVKLLYIVGVNDGIFPAVSKDEGILSDSDRNKLKKLGIEIAEDTKTKTFEEQYLIYKTLTIPERSLRVCYSIADFEGKALRQSIIISRLKAIFPNIIVENNSIDIDESYENLNLISREVPTFNSLVSVLRKEHNGDKEKHSIWNDVYNWYSNNKKWSQKLNTILSAISYTNSVEDIAEEKIRKLYGDKLYLSVSRIEKYIQCPFGYYIQYGLKAKDRKVFGLTPPDLGTFMHNVIDEFSDVVDKSSLKWYEIEEKWCIDTVSDIVDKNAQSVSGGIFSSSPRYMYFTERLKRVLIKTILVIIEHLKRSGFQPIGHEVGFGKGESYPPIEIELSNGEKVELIGRIDRVDKFELEGNSYYRIIDYKSGNKDFSLSDIYYGVQLQLLTYLDAILSNKESMDKDNVLPGGVLYLKIDDPLIKGSRNITEEEIENEIMKALKMKGLIIDDPKIVKEMDRKIDGPSLIIPARMNKGGVLGKSSVGTEEQFNILREHVKRKLVEACENMLKGEINIEPIKDKNIASCDFCIYSAICQFDTDFDGNKYKIMKEKSDDEIWKMLRKEVEDKCQK